MRTVLLLLVLATAPGCLAAAVAGGAYIIGKGKEADADKSKARLDYLDKRRSSGATDAQILAEIESFDPEWAKEIREGKSGLEVPLR